MSKEQVYIAFLRGINVSGKNKMAMKELVVLCESLGCKAVQTCIQSGNVIFKHQRESGQKLSKLIENAIVKHWRFQVPVLLHTPDSLVSIIDQQPFKKVKNVDLAA